MDIFQSITFGEVVLSIILAIVVVIGKVEKRKEGAEAEVFSIQRLPYEKGTPILSETELKFYHQLKEVVADKYMIFPKVPLDSIVQVKNGMNNDDHHRFEHEIKSRTASFLLCEPKNTKVIAAIALKDISNSEAEEIVSFVNKVFETAKIPLMRFKIRGSYSEEILEQLKATINFREEETEQA